MAKLDSNNKFLGILTGSKGGCDIIDDQLAHSVNFDSAVVLQDAIISALEINDVDVLTDSAFAEKYNFTGKTLPAGFVLSRLTDYPFSKITLTSGIIEIFLSE